MIDSDMTVRLEEHADLAKNDKTTHAKYVVSFYSIRWFRRLTIIYI